MKKSLIFWLWNDRLEPAEIRRQIADFHKKHIDGFFVHAMPEEFRSDDFPGGMPGYLSRHFFDMVEVAAECAASFGMELWLYDEGGWPSGTVNNSLMKEHPELCLHAILPSGEIVAEPTRPDLLNSAVTGLFIEHVHEKYAKRLKPYFGNVIPGIFTDEPYFGVFDPPNRIPWSPVLAERFQERKKYGLRECAMRIFREDDKQARIDYCEVWNSLIAEGYMQPLQQWCHKNKLIFTGHFNGDDCLLNIGRLLGSDIFHLHRYFDLPGCDAILRQLHPLVPESDFCCLTASAAGGRPVISESFAVYGADLSLAEMKQIAAMQFVSGITVIAPMAVHYSNRGGRQVTTCSDLSGVDPRWEHYACFSDFLRRMSSVFNRALPVIKASVPFPVRELRAGNADMELFRQGLALAEKQITYDYAPEAPPVIGEIERDLVLESPCPALRTRHLRTAHGERRILVNAGTAPLHCRFAAPAGVNLWFDPASGKKTSACADSEGKLTLDLPFGGVMILLTRPGRAQKKKKTEVNPHAEALLFRKDRAVRAFKAGENGLVEVFPVPEELDENMSGTIRWIAEFDSGEAKAAVLELPSARRAICRAAVNGKELGILPWGPYQWKCDLVKGKNLIAVDLTGTPAAALYAPRHIQWLKEQGYMNRYLPQCLEFQPLFPDENPLTDARLLM